MAPSGSNGSSSSSTAPTTTASDAPPTSKEVGGRKVARPAVQQPLVRSLLLRAAKHYGCDLDTFITILSGSVSGVAATFAKQPIQRVKWIRQVHEGEAIPYSRILKDTVSSVHRINISLPRQL